MSEKTIESGLQTFLAKEKFHRDAAERYARLIDALREADKELSSGKDKLIDEAPKSGRPLDEEVRKVVRKAIDSLPDKFTFSQLKEAVNGVDVATFRRIFREVRADGVVVEKIRAVGVRDGVYEKIASG